MNNMNKAVLVSIGFVVGASVGFAVGYAFNERKHEKDIKYVEPVYVEPKDEKPEPKNPQSENFEKLVQKTVGEGSLYAQMFSSKPAKLATEDEKGINYTDYVKELKYKQETQTPPEDVPEGEESDIPEEEIDMEQFEENYEERLERENRELAERAENYKKEHKGKIELMPASEWDTDYPETDYEREDLYYFTESDILTDENGNQLDEMEYLGPKVRQVGWFQSPEENIYVRNHPKLKEFRVFKEHCSAQDWF